MGYGSWVMGHGSWVLVDRPWVMGNRSGMDTAIEEKAIVGFKDLKIWQRAFETHNL
jgi:hypothetical protein